MTMRKWTNKPTISPGQSTPVHSNREINVLPGPQRVGAKTGSVANVSLGTDEEANAAAGRNYFPVDS
jgi:hypothetical protein